MNAGYYTLPPRTRRYRMILACDLLLAAISLPVAGLLWASSGALIDGEWHNLRVFLGGSIYMVPVFVVIAACVFQAFGTPRGLWRYFSFPDLLVVVKSVSLAVLLMVLTLFTIDRLNSMPRSVPLLQWLVLVTALAGSRLFYRRLWIARRRPRNGRRSEQGEPVLIVGEGDGIFAAIEASRSHPTPYWIVGILDPRSGHVGRSIGQIPIVGTPDNLERVMANLSIHGIHPQRLLLTSTGSDLSRRTAAGLRAEAARIGLVVEAVEKTRGPCEPVMRGADGRPDVPFTPPGLKRTLEFVAVAALLLFTLPLFALAALLVRVGLGSPIIFSQVRPGRHMRPFTVHKFRTLLHLDESTAGLSDNGRETSVGRFLRRTRLDELPQLWNVLVGDMSLIGPRPLLARELACSPELLAERCSVRPGITGWAQVNGGHRLALEEKLALDLWYIRHRSTRLDLQILLLTLRMMILGDHVNIDAIRDACQVK